MANVQKFQSSQTGRMCAHYERAPDCFGNEYIDKSKTYMNYNLAEKDQPLNQIEFIKKRKSEVKYKNRKDLKVMCDWVVTLPETVKPEDEDLFFKNTYDFLNQRYGKENVISAYVHKDETTHHMHYAFIPIIYDRNLEDFKISAKEVISLSDLRSFHGDLEKYLEKNIGYRTGVITNDTNINLSLRKYKVLMKEIDLIKDKIKEIEGDEPEINPITRTYKKESVEKLIDLNKYLKQEKTYIETQNESLWNTLLFARNELQKTKLKLKNYNYDELLKKKEELDKLIINLIKEKEELKIEILENREEINSLSQSVDILKKENEEYKKELNNNINERKNKEKNR